MGELGRSSGPMVELRFLFGISVDGCAWGTGSAFDLVSKQSSVMLMLGGEFVVHLCANALSTCRPTYILSQRMIKRLFAQR